jgi:hypothetical protein
MIEALVPEASVPGPTGPVPRRVKPVRRWNSGTSAASFLALPEGTYGRLETETEVEGTSPNYRAPRYGMAISPTERFTLPAGTFIKVLPGGIFAFPPGTDPENWRTGLALRSTELTVQNIAATLIEGPDEE